MSAVVPVVSPAALAITTLSTPVTPGATTRVCPPVVLVKRMHVCARASVDHLAHAVLRGSPDQEHIVAVSPVQRIVACPAIQRIVARAPVQCVRAIRADQEIGAGTAGDSH